MYAEPFPHPSGATPPVIAADLLPKHVAIVMDGNGRWANARGLPRTKGHEAGEASLLDVVAGAIEVGVTHLSAYAFSTENWRRSPDEVRFLMGFNRDVIRRRRDQLHEWGVRMRWVGRAPRLWRSVIKELEVAQELTQHNTGLTLYFCVNYGGSGRDRRRGAAHRRTTSRRAGSDRARSTRRRSSATSTSRRCPTSTSSCAARASSARATSCCGSRPMPRWSSRTGSGPTTTAATSGPRSRTTSTATAATAAPSTPPTPLIRSLPTPPPRHRATATGPSHRHTGGCDPPRWLGTVSVARGGESAPGCGRWPRGCGARARPDRPGRPTSPGPRSTPRPRGRPVAASPARARRPRASGRCT